MWEQFKSGKYSRKNGCISRLGGELELTYVMFYHVHVIHCSYMEIYVQESFLITKRKLNEFDACNNITH